VRERVECDTAPHGKGKSEKKYNFSLLDSNASKMPESRQLKDELVYILAATGIVNSK
jgi:hypothetical protein